ncbi:ATPase, AAA family protein [Toxoplasma gondii p89]|uniref:ATPase, AAA family protein n=4 Tax=Toxoplasma gondii TaxID=5811 RepID=A0A086JRZ1_TOXGO|nr:ATPase, AAA family protein [Toxoplasma gondii FOU]KFG37200.1 ATPase, AAA family protein [Toxoplasma gondii p89]PUA85054.1 ATPase, AAA family protein [Toxoplasma gondii TgCATBr9]RQX70210.1 ATPase, AAA family protein [Toxoplasma gondii CAST]
MECLIEATVSTWGNAPPLIACGVCASAATLAQLGAAPSSSRLLRLQSDVPDFPPCKARHKDKRKILAPSSSPLASSDSSSSASSSYFCPGACVVQVYCAEEDLSPPVKLPLNKFLLTSDVLFSLGLLSPFSAGSLPADTHCFLSFLSLSVPLPRPSPVTLCLTRAPGDHQQSRSSASSLSSSLSSSLPSPSAAWWEQLLLASAASQDSAVKAGLHSTCSSFSSNEFLGSSSYRGSGDTQQPGGTCGEPKKSKQQKFPARASPSSSESSTFAPSSSSSTTSPSSFLAASLSVTPQASQGLLRFFRIALNGASVVNGQFRSMTLHGHPVVLQIFVPSVSLSETSDAKTFSPSSVSPLDSNRNKDGKETETAAAVLSNCFRLSASTQMLFTLQPTWPERERKCEINADERAENSSEMANSPRGGLNRVGGLHRVLPELMWSLILPLLRPDLFQAYGVLPPKGVLLYGPPGSGKTHLARALAEEIQVVAEEVNKGTAPAPQESLASSSPLSAFLRALLRLPADASGYSSASSSCVLIVPPHLELINATDLISPVVGQTERNIHQLFERCRREQRKRLNEARAEVAVRTARAAVRRAGRDSGQTSEATETEEATKEKCGVEGEKAGANCKNQTDKVEGCGGKQTGDSPVTLVGGGTLLFIDEIDAVCPKREEATEVGRRAVCALLSCLDGIATDGSLFVLAATNHPYLLDDAIRRAGRLERDIEVGVPTAEERREILAKLLESVPHNLRDEDIHELSGLCQAFVPADLRLLVTTAATQALKAFLPIETSGGMPSDDTRDELQGGEEATESVPGALAFLSKENKPVTLKHFRRALRHVKPSALKSVAIEVPQVKWDEIGGYASVKKSLQECVEWPLKYAHLFRQLKVSPPRGVLLYGPPGCSKTMMAKAVATESKMNFISVKGPELFSKWVGESERAVREVFRKARQNAPCVIFFDEVDAMGGDRETGDAGGVDSRVLSQLLNEMDGIGPVREVIVIAATNRPDLLDAALLRPGRLDRLVYVPLPDWEARREIVVKMLKNMPVRFSGELRGDSKRQGSQEVARNDGQLSCADSGVPRIPSVVSGSENFKREDVEVRDQRNAEDETGDPERSRERGVSKHDGCSSREVDTAASSHECSGSLEVCADSLASATHGYSGAEIVMICREASMAAVREAVARYTDQQLQHQRCSAFSEKVELKLSTDKSERTQCVQESSDDGNVFVEERHLKFALSRVQPRTPASLLAFYEAYRADSPWKGSGGS